MAHPKGHEPEHSPKHSLDKQISQDGSSVPTESAPTPPPGPPPALAIGKPVLLVAIAMFVIVLGAGGQQGLNIALPALQAELGIPQNDLQWVASAYGLASGCLVPLSGRLADIYGRKTCFIIGIGWYAVWNLVGSFLHDRIGFIVTRALAGMGASMGAPSAFGLIAANIHGKDRATAFAMFSAGAPLGAGTGIVLGGVFTAYTEPTWRAVLWFFSGLGFFAALLAVLFVPKDSPHPHDRRLDLVGAAMITTGLVLFQFTISFAGTKGWKTPYIAALFPVSVILIVAFFFWEYHVIHHTSRPPLVSLALFTRAKGRLASMYFVGFIAMAGFVSIGFNATLFYQQVQQASAMTAALQFLPCIVSGLFATFGLSRLVHFIPGQMIICCGFLCTGISATLFALSKRDQVYWTLPFNGMWLMVIGVDFLMATGAIFVSRLALAQEQSVAGAMFQTLLQLGGALGLALTSVLATTERDRALKQGWDYIDALLKGLQSAFWLSASLNFAALLLGIVMLRGMGIVGGKGRPGGPGAPAKPTQPSTMPAEDEEKGSVDPDSKL